MIGTEIFINPTVFFMHRRQYYLRFLEPKETCFPKLRFLFFETTAPVGTKLSGASRYAKSSTNFLGNGFPSNFSTDSTNGNSSGLQSVKASPSVRARQVRPIL